MLIDLTWNIEEHWRYSKFKREMIQSFDKGDLWQVTGFNMGSHWFSHMDFPRHTGPDYPSSDDFPLEHYNGMASVIDISRSSSIANYGFNKSDLEKAVKKHAKLHDIWLLRSNWELECSHMTREFWLNAPYLTEDAILYLKDQGIKTIAFDFPQDYSIRLLVNRPVGPDEQLTHIHLLRNNILLIEYVGNFDKIPTQECEFICLPLKFKNIDGAPVRAVAKV